MGLVKTLRIARLIALTLDTSSSYKFCRNSNVVRRTLAADARLESFAGTFRAPAAVLRVRGLSILSITLGFRTTPATLVL